jgi:hypothetical protein
MARTGKTKRRSSFHAGSGSFCQENWIEVRLNQLEIEGKLFQPIHLYKFHRHGRAVRLLGHQLPRVPFSATCSASPISRGCFMRARREFVERPKHLVEHEDCLSCRYSRSVTVGCPVRTYSALGTMLAKDRGDLEHHPIIFI